MYIQRAEFYEDTKERNNKDSCTREKHEGQQASFLLLSIN